LSGRPIGEKVKTQSTGNHPSASSEDSGIKGWLKTADQYCFGMTSPTTMGLFRILVGILAFINWSMIGLDWDAWFSERGYVPSWLGALFFGRTSPVGFYTNWEIPRLNLLSGITDPRATIPFYILVLVAALFTSLGLCTRVASFLLAVGTITLHHRNGAILHGGDTVLRIAIIYTAISPSGRACSLDRLIALWKNRETHAPVRVSVWPQRLVQYNVALIYFTTLWLKMDGDKWRFLPWTTNSLTATWDPQRLAEFYRFPIPDFFRSLFMARVTTLGTIATEFLMGTLVFFPPARKWVLLCGILMHSYIEYSMNIPLFSFLMFTMYLSFYEGHEVSGWAERMGLRLRRWHVLIRLPSGMRLTPRAVAFLDSIDPFKMISYLPGDTSQWVANRIDGTPIAVSKAIATRSLGAWIFAWAPGTISKILSKSLEPSPEPEPEPPVQASTRKRR
jgi:hypothetical protein